MTSADHPTSSSADDAFSSVFGPKHGPIPSTTTWQKELRRWLDQPDRDIHADAQGLFRKDTLAEALEAARKGAAANQGKDLGWSELVHCLESMQRDGF